MENKLKTGVPGLDAIFLGGLIRNRSYLLLGSAGTGKTILALQWLIAGQALGEKCLYISLAERQEDIQSNIESFGWNLNGIEVIDLVPTENEQKETIEEYHVFTPEDVEQSGVWKAIYQAIFEK